MRGNSNIIGPKSNLSLNTATGIHDIFDNYNARLDNTWPKVKNFISITPNSGSYNEGSSISFTVVVEGFQDNDLIYYNIEAVSGSTTTSDFTDGLISGPISVINNSAVFTKTLVLDGTSESDSFRVNIRTGSTSGPIIGSSGTFTINNPSFSVTPSSSSFNEGSSVTWNVATTNVNNGQLLYYSYSGTPANSGDISSALTGNFTVNSSGAGTFVTTATADFTTEGNETLTAYVRVGSTSGTIVAQNSVTINDTSLTPAATVTPTTTSIDEGSSVTFNVSTTNYTTGTLYYTVENVSNFERSDLNSTSGSFTITNSSGSFALTATSDGYTEGPEQFLVRIRFQSTSGTILATSDTITINDTSTGAPEPLGIDIVSSFYPISEYVNQDNAADTVSNYSVSQVQQNYSGNGRLYLVHKVTAATSFYDDTPIACIQVLDSTGSTVVEQWWFGASGDGKGWTTNTSQYNFGAIGSGINITPDQAATNYTYTTSVVNGAVVNTFSLATSTASSSTGAADGIAEPIGPMPLGEKTIPQSLNTWYMYRETSGSTSGFCSICRSPSRTWSSGEIIRIAYIIGNLSTVNYYRPSDTLFVGISSI